MRKLSGGIPCKPVGTFVHDHSLRLWRKKTSKSRLRDIKEDMHSEACETGEKTAHLGLKTSCKQNHFSTLRYQG